MPILNIDDVRVLTSVTDDDKAQALVDGANALALTVAPCLGDEDLDATKAKAAKLILALAVVRWLARGDGITVDQQAGPYQWTVHQSNGGLLWPSEIQALQGICGTGSTTGQSAFSIDMTPELPSTGGHWVDSTTWVAE